jgi:KEOPS complex subunit Pcc1
MKAEATVRLRLKSKKQLESIFKALEPETRTALTSRSKVQMTREGNCLKLTFTASDTSALRAAMNSYLRWILLTGEVLEALETEE